MSTGATEKAAAAPRSTRSAGPVDPRHGCWAGRLSVRFRLEVAAAVRAPRRTSVQEYARVLPTADRVVILGTGLDVARLPGPRYVEWDLTHDDLVARVETLADDLTAAPAAGSGSAVRDRLRTLIGATRRR